MPCSKNTGTFKVKRHPCLRWQRCIQHNNTQYIDIQQDDTQHNWLVICDIQHNGLVVCDIQHNGLVAQTYILSLDWTKICGPNWQLFYSTAEKQHKMC